MVSDIIKIKEIDEPLASRVTAKRLYRKTLDLLEKEDVEKVTFDFRGVEYLSTGVARDLFGNLYKDLGDKFTKKIDFIFDDNKEIILASVARGLKAAADK